MCFWKGEGATRCVWPGGGGGDAIERSLLWSDVLTIYIKYHFLFKLKINHKNEKSNKRLSYKITYLTFTRIFLKLTGHYLLHLGGGGGGEGDREEKFS